MVCLEGSVRYLEYDWVARPAGFILEMPGEAHTLVTDHPEGCKLFGWMQGPNEFYDPDGKFVRRPTSGGSWTTTKATAKSNGIPINPRALYPVSGFRAWTATPGPSHQFDIRRPQRFRTGAASGIGLAYAETWPRRARK